MKDIDSFKKLMESVKAISELDTKTRPARGLKDRLLNKEPRPAAHPDDTLSDRLNPKVKRREKSMMSLKDRIAQGHARSKDPKRWEDDSYNEDISEATSGSTTANFEALTDDMKRMMSDGSVINVTARESHISDHYKGDIYSYKITPGTMSEDVNEDSETTLHYDLMDLLNNMGDPHYTDWLEGIIKKHFPEDVNEDGVAGNMADILADLEELVMGMDEFSHEGAVLYDIIEKYSAQQSDPERWEDDSYNEGISEDHDEDEWDFEYDNDECIILHNNKPVLTLPIDAWRDMIKTYNRIERKRD